MNTFRIYHNPRCSKSRQTLALLEEHGVHPQVIDYIKTPLTPDEIKNLLKLLGYNARQLLRTKEEEYKTQQLSDETLSETAIINAMAKHPKLIERPIVVDQNHHHAIIGRPPERVLELLD